MAPLPDAIFESKQLIKKIVIKLPKIAEMTSVNSSPYAELHKNQKIQPMLTVRVTICCRLFHFPLSHCPLRLNAPTNQNRRVRARPGFTIKVLPISVTISFKSQASKRTELHGLRHSEKQSRPSSRNQLMHVTVGKGTRLPHG